MIKVLIVDDSKTVSQYLEFVFGEEPDIEVIGVVCNGVEAIDFIKKNKPDIITMDIDMPRMNGLEATRIIMSTTPIPIIMVTASRNANDKKVGIEALAVGALSIVNKPVGFSNDKKENKTQHLIRLIRIYAQVKVITRIYRPKENPIPNTPLSIEDKKKILPISKLLNKKYVTVGVSSGGPTVLAEVFSKISHKFPYPIIVVQHITAGFLDSMVAWLNRLLSIPVKIAERNEELLPGCIYFAPDYYQMCIKDNKVDLSEQSDIRICPSVEHLFKQQALSYGKDTIAVMLTGMGRDGASELKLLKDSGAVTIAQDKESALVYGMPGEAINCGAISYVLSPGQIAETLLKIEQF